VVYGVFRYNACAGPRDAGTAVYQQSTGQQIGEVIVGSSSCVTYALPVF
jgi:hypothetical protein